MLPCPTTGNIVPSSMKVDLQNERITFRLPDHVLAAAQSLVEREGLAKISVLTRSLLIKHLITQGMLAEDGGPLQKPIASEDVKTVAEGTPKKQGVPTRRKRANG